MSDLISRSALIEELENYCPDYQSSTVGCILKRAVNECIKIVNEHPTIEAVPVVHAKWIDEGDYLATAYGKLDARTCSACKCVITIDDYDNYCPACGARMDGVE